MNAFHAVRPRFGLCRSALHRELADSQPGLQRRNLEANRSGAKPGHPPQTSALIGCPQTSPGVDRHCSETDLSIETPWVCPPKPVFHLTIKSVLRPMPTSGGHGTTWLAGRLETASTKLFLIESQRSFIISHGRSDYVACNSGTIH
jgi:hypothetical protein